MFDLLVNAGWFDDSRICRFVRCEDRITFVLTIYLREEILRKENGNKTACILCNGNCFGICDVLFEIIFTSMGEQCDSVQYAFYRADRRSGTAFRLGSLGLAWDRAVFAGALCTHFPGML